MMLDYFYGQSGELFAYFRIPKALFQDSRFRQLSTDARTLYGILLDRMSLSAKNSWVDEHGRVYIIYTVREVQESLCCAEHKAVKLFRELEQADLIERKRRGLGRPSLIYVKNFSSGLPKAQIQNCANSNSCAAESAVQVRPKSQSNKTDKNKTERNHPFLPDETDRLTQREQLEDYFYQALEVELLLRLCPDDEDAMIVVPFCVLINDFIAMWVGAEYILPASVVVLLVMDLYIHFVHSVNVDFINAAGLFREDRDNEIIAAVLNITLSILGAKTIGLAGVLLGTVVSQMWFWFGRSYVVFKLCLQADKEDYLKYWLKNIVDEVALTVSIVFCAYLNSRLPIANSYLKFVCSGILCEAVSVALFGVFHFGDPEVRKMLKYLVNHIRKR